MRAAQRRRVRVPHALRRRKHHLGRGCRGLDVHAGGQQAGGVQPGLHRHAVGHCAAVALAAPQLRRHLRHGPGLRRRQQLHGAVLAGPSAPALCEYLRAGRRVGHRARGRCPKYWGHRPAPLQGRDQMDAHDEAGLHLGVLRGRPLPGPRGRHHRQEPDGVRRHADRQRHHPVPAAPGHHAQDPGALPGPLLPPAPGLRPPGQDPVRRPLHRGGRAAPGLPHVHVALRQRGQCGGDAGGLLREVAGPTAAVVPGDRSAGAGARQPQHDAWGHFHGRGLRRLRPPQLPDGLR
mmetsp:Transcript_19953/g.34298  ORF Transcript_19953/g.34298 Transcript_19953/m.34298 type:complete len:291 (-) Transcript_19953:121-993(-)